MRELREYLNVSNEQVNEELPRVEERKGWTILRFDPSQDDLSVIDQERLDKWEQDKTLLIVLQIRSEGDELLGDELQRLNELKDRLDAIDQPYFDREEELEEYLEREHRPEFGET